MLFECPASLNIGGVNWRLRKYDSTDIVVTDARHGGNLSICVSLFLNTQPDEILESIPLPFSHNKPSSIGIDREFLQSLVGTVETVCQSTSGIMPRAREDVQSNAQVKSTPHRRNSNAVVSQLY